MDYFAGQLAFYAGGGYVANLGETSDSAAAVVNDLEAEGWIDQYTRAVFVEIATWNPNSGLFNLAVVLLEYPPEGKVLWSTRMDVVQLYRYSPPGGPLALLVEIICITFVTIITILEVRRIVREQHRYFETVWNIVQLLSLALFYAAVCVYAMRCMWTVWTVDDMINNPGESKRQVRVVYTNNPC